MSDTGIVHLIGTGPGNPELVTLHAKKIISDADVIVYDNSIHPELLGWRKPDCELVNIEKKNGKNALSQEEIAQLLVRHAKENKRVARLIDGDPFVFERAGDEALALAHNNIRFEIVPGIAAVLAAAACAGIPLSQSNTGASIVFLNGHETPGKKTSGKNETSVDWRACAKLKQATLAIHMGMKNLPAIASELLAGGMPATTPAAIVQWASLGRQRSITGTLANIADMAATAHPPFASPAIILIGETAALQNRAAWFEKLPLYGRRIAITRARDQNSELREKLETLGADVLELPLITIVPAVDKSALIEIFSELGSYDWIVFTSANGVRIFFEQFHKGFDDIRSLGLLRFACVGRATTRAIESHNIKVECMPGATTGESLADALIATGSLDSSKIIVVTGNQNRDALVKKLMDARAIVDRLPLYKNEKTDLTADSVAEDFRENGADAVLFASSSAAESYAAQAGALKFAPNAKRPLHGSIGPLTTETMREKNIAVDFEARTANMDTLIAALAKRLKAG